MSKKSTSRTGSDGDADFGSTNGRNSSSKKSSHLSNKEEAAARACGDYSLTHEILTPNLDNCHRNHVVNNTSDSYSSLDEDLYGTSDAYNKNLDYLKTKLSLLVIQHADVTVENTNQKVTDSKSSCQDTSKGYLSTRETYINLNSPLENCKASENLRTYSPNSMGYSDLNKSIITTIYEAPEIYETDNTTSTDSYKIPLKKVCLREIETKNLKMDISKSPGRLNLTLPPSETSNELILSSVVSSPTTLLTLSTDNLHTTSSDVSSSGSSIHYFVPTKKRKTIDFSTSKTPPSSFFRTTHTQCHSADFHASGDIQRTPSHLQLPKESECCSSRAKIVAWAEVISDNYTERTKSSEILELGLNIPSSIIGDCTTSCKTTPLEPNVIIINTKDNKKIKRKNKIGPAPDSSVTSELCDTSSSHKQNLYRKYYEDTSEISSNPNSTPSCIVSTCACRSSATSDISKISRPPKKVVSPQYTKHIDNMKPKVFNPLLSSSLTIPKLSLQVYNFPAISKITSFPGSFVQESHQDGDYVKEEQVTDLDSYRDKAETLLASSTRSPTRRKRLRDKNKKNDARRTESVSTSPTKIHKHNSRKKQSTDMSFYSVPSFITLDEEFNKQSLKTDDSYSDSDEKCANCCCFNLFFPKRNTTFFT